jgi:hypothetical protein
MRLKFAKGRSPRRVQAVRMVAISRLEPPYGASGSRVSRSRITHAPHAVRQVQLRMPGLRLVEQAHQRQPSRRIVAHRHDGLGGEVRGDGHRAFSGTVIRPAEKADRGR